MERHHHQSHPLYNFQILKFIHNKYNDLLIADTLRTFALSMVSLFVPIFLVKEAGFSLLSVILMELGIFIGSICIHYVVLKYINAWGVKKTMITSYAFNIALYLSLFCFEALIGNLGKTSFLIIAGICEVLSMGLYWTSHHVYFFSVSKFKNEGKKIGLLYAIPSLIGVAGPLVGSFIITDFDFRGVFLLSTILLVFASYILFFTHEIKSNISVTYSRIWDKKKMSKNLIFFIQGASYVATGFFWPLLLFYNSIQLISMGFLFLFSNIAYSIVSYAAGCNSDKKKSRGMSRIGSIGQSVSLFFRVAVESIFGITAFQIMGGIFGGLLQISLEASFYKHSHEEFGSAIMNRELYMYLGRVFITITFILLLISFGIINALILVIALSAVLLFALNFTVKKDLFLMGE